MYDIINKGGNMTTKHDLVITALQQRIGELVASYETQIAILRADLTEMVNNSNKDLNIE